MNPETIRIRKKKCSTQHKSKEYVETGLVYQNFREWTKNGELCFFFEMEVLPSLCIKMIYTTFFLLKLFNGILQEKYKN
jgi:hypothetical protein